MPETRRFEGPSDLHLHSIHSDGTESPAQVMAAAHRHGLRTAALTDHDTTSGWAEAAEAASSLGMTFLPGMELSAKYEWRSVHVLAYLIDPDDADLRAMIDRIRSSRLERARTMADRIGEDFDLHWDDIVAQTSDGATVGRPHIADALVAKGLVRDRAEAFSQILIRAATTTSPCSHRTPWSPSSSSSVPAACRSSLIPPVGQACCRPV